MNSSERLQFLWQRDVPPPSDMTFVLATLQRMERRRLRRGVLSVLCAGLISIAALWWSAPELLESLEPVFIELQSAASVEFFVATAILAIIVLYEWRSFR